MIPKEQLVKFIDFTLLKPDTTKDSIIKLCKEAKKYNFHSVCVNPTYVSLASENLKETNIKVCSVIGFPLGACTAEVKALEAVDAINNGANEIDVVLNIGALKSHDFKLIKEELSEIVKAVNNLQKNTIIKIIIETGLLTKYEKEKTCALINNANVDFVKTSTGFNTIGATIHDIKLLKKLTPNLKIKASGGIKTLHDAKKFIKAGAERIGTSSGVAIMEQYQSKSNKGDAIKEKKKDSFLYFLSLINWQNPLSYGELNELINYLKTLGETSQLGDWLKIKLDWEKEICDKISTSELGFYHSRFIFRFKLLVPPKNMTEIRKLREDIENKIEDFFINDKQGVINEIKEKNSNPPYIFVYPVFELNKKAEFWKPIEKKPYSLQTTCFFTELDDPKGKPVKMRISGAQIISTNMSKWFFETLVNIIFHEGLYRQTRDRDFLKKYEKKLIYWNLENRLEDFASGLMTIFHQYSSDSRRHKIQKIALVATITGLFLGFLYFICDFIINILMVIYP